MQIKKELLITAVDDNGQALEEGKTYLFDIEEGKSLCGKFVGITKRGALSFESLLSSVLVTFNIMPGSILAIKQVEVKECELWQKTN